MSMKQKCPEFENHERWLVSYADMLTLLFAVFVVLYSLNMSGEDKAEQVSGSLQESFNTPLDEIPVDKRVGPSETGFGIFDHFRGDTAMPPLIQKYPGRPKDVHVIEEEMNRLKINLEERLYGPEKYRSSDKPGFDRIVDIQRTANGFKLRLAARHFFESGDSKIKKEALSDLNNISKILKDLGRPITIEGHTDSVPVEGNYSNWELSALRSTSVLRYLIRQHNYPPTKLSAAGYADTRPIASNGSESGRALNRRIEIQVHYDDTGDIEPVE